MKKFLVRLGLVALIVVLGIIVVVPLMLGSLVKNGVETVGPRLTQTELRLESARLSLFSGSGTLKGLFVGNPAGYKSPSAIQVGAISLRVEPKSVFSDKVHVTELHIQSPDITFEGSLKGNNLSKILENVQTAVGSGAGGSQPKDSGAGKKLQVDHLIVTGGKIHLSATVLGGRGVTLPLPNIELKNLGQGPEGITSGELSAKLLSEITTETLKAVQKGVADLGLKLIDTVGDAAKEAVEQTGKAVKKIGDLFRR